MLEVEAIYREYPDQDGKPVSALRGVTLAVDVAELVAVVGPSGSGKSTLLQITGGLDVPTSGVVSVDGKEVSSMNEKERTAFRRDNVGFVFQAFHLVPSMTVAENVALSAIVRDKRRSAWVVRAERLLSQVGLSEMSGRLPHQLSGGQKQRVAVARALFPEPALLLADEPTGNLDARSRDDVLRLIRNGVSASDRSAAMMVTHDQIAASYADRVIAVHDGRIVSELDMPPATDVGMGWGESGRVDSVRAWMATAPL